MRLWHKDLLPLLPRQQLLGQHSECAALRGLGWGVKHATVDYVFKHPYAWLFGYHLEVMRQMLVREYDVDPLWTIQNYRGKKIGYDNTAFCAGQHRPYPEHNDAYLRECLENLAGKGIVINVSI